MPTSSVLLVIIVFFRVRRRTCRCFSRSFSFPPSTPYSATVEVKPRLISFLYIPEAMNNHSACDSASPSDACTNSPAMIGNGSFIPIFSILLVVVMLIGVAGNLLVIYVVLNYGRLKTVTNTYLLHLALSDLVFLSGIPFFVSSILTRAWIFGGFVCKLFFLTQGVNQYTSIIILALLSFDRYLAVCYSAKSIVWRSRVSPNLLLILTWILSFLLMLPIITFTTLHKTSASKVQCTIILPYPQSRFLYFVVIAYTSTITFLFPISLMIYFYIRIVWRLKYKVSQHQARSRSSIYTRRKVSVLVLVVITVHVVCCAPYWAFQVLTTSELLPQTSALLVPTSSIAQFLLFVNSATNPVLYAFLSEVFRSSFKRVFYCCLSVDHDQFLHDNTMVKRNLPANSNKMDYSPVKIEDIPLETMPCDPNHSQASGKDDSLSLTAKSVSLNPIHVPDRHLSLAPTISVFSTEVSSATDM